MSSIQELREQRAAKAKAVAELVAKKEWNKEKDQPLYDAGMAEIDDLDAKISRINASNEMIARAGVDNSVAEGAERAARDQKKPVVSLYAKWLRGGDNALSAAEWQTIRGTLGTQDDTQGGYTVQTDVAKVMLDALKIFGGMRAASNVLQTAQGNPISFPTSDGTTETGEIIAENVTATSADPTFSAKGLPVFKYSSKIAAIPFELLQDSSVDIEAFVRNRLTTRLGRIQNTHFTVGTGANQPNGVVTAASTGYTATNGTTQTLTITYASLLELIHSIDPAYRQLGNCKFMMSDTFVKKIRAIVDGNSRPLFTPGWMTQIPGVTGSQPDSLMGYPIVVNNDVAVPAISAKSMLFGDFSFYTIRDVMSVQMFRFTDSAYTKLGQVGFLAWMRSGGNLIDVGGAVKLFINAAS